MHTAISFRVPGECTVQCGQLTTPGVVGVGLRVVRPQVVDDGVDILRPVGKVGWRREGAGGEQGGEQALDLGRMEEVEEVEGGEADLCLLVMGHQEGQLWHRGEGGDAGKVRKHKTH